MTPCAMCAKPFVQRSSMHKVCSPACAIRTVKRKRQQEKADYKRRQEAAKPRSQWLKEAQAAFNQWIRIRDAQDPCISCGRMHQGQYHAGHYLSTGARPELRFDPNNCHKQCQPCNTHLHGNLVLYRSELIKRIGLHEVERLEGPHTARKFTAQDLKAIKDTYRTKVKAHRD